MEEYLTVLIIYDKVKAADSRKIHHENPLIFIVYF